MYVIIFNIIALIAIIVAQFEFRRALREMDKVIFSRASRRSDAKDNS